MDTCGDVIAFPVLTQSRSCDAALKRNQALSFHPRYFPTRRYGWSRRRSFEALPLDSVPFLDEFVQYSAQEHLARRDTTF